MRVKTNIKIEIAQPMAAVRRIDDKRSTKQVVTKNSRYGKTAQTKMAIPSPPVFHCDALPIAKKVNIAERISAKDFIPTNSRPYIELLYHRLTGFFRLRGPNLGRKTIA